VSLSWACSIQSTPAYPTSWRSILILSSPQCLVFASGLISSGFSTKPCVHLPSTPNVLHAPPILFFQFYHLSIRSKDVYFCIIHVRGNSLFGRVQLKRDGTWWRMEGEVKGKLANGVGSQYPSHHLGTWCIQHY
jgi:hypothetical protein